MFAYIDADAFQRVPNNYLCGFMKNPVARKAHSSHIIQTLRTDSTLEGFAFEQGKVV